MKDNEKEMEIQQLELKLKELQKQEQDLLKDIYKQKHPFKSYIKNCLSRLWTR
jgi:hypothetical protein